MDEQKNSLLYKENAGIAQLKGMFDGLQWDEDIDKLDEVVYSLMLMHQGEVVIVLGEYVGKMKDEDRNSLYVFHIDDSRVKDTMKHARTISWFRDKYFKINGKKSVHNDYYYHDELQSTSRKKKDDGSCLQIKLMNIAHMSCFDDFTELHFIDPNLVEIEKITNKLSK